MIIFDDRAGLIGLSVVSARSPTRFVRAISNLKPKDRRQIIQPEITAPDGLKLPVSATGAAETEIVIGGTTTAPVSGGVLVPV